MVCIILILFASLVVGITVSYLSCEHTRKEISMWNITNGLYNIGIYKVYRCNLCEKLKEIKSGNEWLTIPWDK